MPRSVQEIKRKTKFFSLIKYYPLHSIILIKLLLLKFKIKKFIHQLFNNFFKVL